MTSPIYPYEPRRLSKDTGYSSRNNSQDCKDSLMTGKFRLILISFIIVTSFTTAMSYVVKHPLFATYTSQDPRYFIAAYSIMGVVLSILLTLVIAVAVKSVKEPKVVTEIPKSKEEKDKVDARVVQTLSLLQKGRLIDFLHEELEGIDEAQIGAAVKTIHKECKEALDEYVIIEPVLDELEDNEVTINEGFDPSAVRLIGNVVGEPPFKGILRHPGWRVSSTKLPKLPKNQDTHIIEPAEVELL